MSGITWEVAQLLNDSAAQIRALKASNEALREAANRLLVQLNHAGCWCADCRAARRALLDAAPTDATKDFCASSLTSNAQPPSLSAVEE